MKEDSPCVQDRTIDLTEVTQSSPPHLIGKAKAMCGACPNLTACRTWCEDRTVAGFAAGQFEDERRTVKTPALRLDQHIVDDVLRYTRAGRTAREIALIMGISTSNIAYIRRTRRDS